MTSLTIGALAKATSTKVETIRWYERVGMLPVPSRSAGNYRSYDTSHLGRLSFIRRGRSLGFSLDQIRALLGLAEDRERSCEAVDAIAREHLEEVDQKIADLHALRRELVTVIDGCHGGRVAECGIIDALGPTEFRGPR